MWRNIKSKLYLIILFCLVSSVIFTLINCTLGFMEYGMLPQSYYNSPICKEELLNIGTFMQRILVSSDKQGGFDEEKVSQKEIDAYYSKQTFKVKQETAIKDILEAKKQSFEQLIEKISKLEGEVTNLEYWVINEAEGRIISNLQEGNLLKEAQVTEYFKSKKAYIIGNGQYILEQNGKRQKLSWGNLQKSLEEGELAENYRLYIGLKQPLQSKDDFYKAKSFYDERNAKINLYYKWGVTAFLQLVGIGICLMWRKKLQGPSNKELETQEAGSKIREWILPIDRVGLVALVSLSGVLYLYFSWKQINYWEGSWLPAELEKGYEVENISLLGISALGAGIGLMILSLFKKAIKRPGWYEAIYIYKLWEWSKNKIVVKQFRVKEIKGALKKWQQKISSYLHSEKNYVKLTVLVGIGILGIKGILVYTLFKESFSYINLTDNKLVYINSVLLILIEIFITSIIIKSAVDFSKAMGVAKKIEKGELKTQFKLSLSLPALKELSYCLGHIGDGLERAKEESIKNERLKTELITNVSHDLKTPLTSIISYIDLLKEEKIENKVAKEYIEVLDERSNRLKQLVEDLVEASKAMSGNIKAEPEKIQFHQLVEQAVGEYSDRLARNNLEVIIHQLQEAYIEADGRHLWRIIENLLSNVNKYAMPHTRVYIDVLNKGEQAQFILKNTSRDYLNILPEELFGRFTRGDAARSTEGSGLGLAIAQSLTAIQGGTLEIFIDGDLFKVILSFPISV
ncbi:hypothetical protein CS063_11020 [Sporanaerobium hydrogeniformans]|uniref:Uncharacterized protein n=1 Tax=Sporanaerobium hydrogeniformans TaxID=3072179 RepID=A0AC61DCV0_9FIRM|nr:HAMP domain-containing sensor histidine kinase [Sporanaerobium hydrogeniformans]PHV70402.1 hypothetical protein CS063_11020 [Sporanaerobium hydrogeniformans]